MPRQRELKAPGSRSLPFLQREQNPKHVVSIALVRAIKHNASPLTSLNHNIENSILEMENENQSPDRAEAGKKIRQDEGFVMFQNFADHGMGCEKEKSAARMGER